MTEQKEIMIATTQQLRDVVNSHKPFAELQKRFNQALAGDKEIKENLINESRACLYYLMTGLPLNEFAYYFDLLKYAAQLDDSNAQYALGIIYEEALHQISSAKYWYGRVCENENADQEEKNKARLAVECCGAVLF